MLTEARKTAWRRYTDLARRLTIPGLPSPMMEPRSDEELSGAVAAAKVVLEKALRDTDAELVSLQAGITATDDAAWKRLEEACRKIEQDIRNPPSLRTRLDEGRRSMMPKVERLVHSRLTPVIRQQGRKLVATVSEDGIQELRKELPEWVHGWSEYAFGWLDLDIQREIEVAWNRRDGDLPLPPPRFKPLQLPQIQSEIAFPDVSLNRDVGGLAFSVLRNARSIAYGALSCTFLFGIAKNDLPWWVFVIGFAAAMVIGWIMVTDERNDDRKKLEAEVRQRAEQATWDAARTWLDRMSDKLAESARDQLHQRRFELLTWWRREVDPKLKEAEQQASAARARAEQARMQLPRLQEQKRSIQGALGALEGV